MEIALYFDKCNLLVNSHSQAMFFISLGSVFGSVYENRQPPLSSDRTFFASEQRFTLIILICDAENLTQIVVI